MILTRDTVAKNEETDAGCGRRRRVAVVRPLASIRCEITLRLFYVHQAAGLDGRTTGSYIDQTIAGFACDSPGCESLWAPSPSL